MFLEAKYDYGYSIPKISSNFIRRILELIIKRNCFKFDTTYYLQTVGVAMGSESSPEIADITFHLFENELIPLSKHIIRWLRYRDDFFDLEIYSTHFKTLVVPTYDCTFTGILFHANKSKQKNKC